MTPDPTLIEQDGLASKEQRVAEWIKVLRTHAKRTREGLRLQSPAVVGLADLLEELNCSGQGSASLPSEAITPEMIEAGLRERDEGNHGSDAELVSAVYLAMRATTPTAPDQDTGASVPDQALAVPIEPVARLDPAGFDPSRKCNIWGETTDVCPRHEHSHAPACYQPGSFIEHIAKAMFDCYRGYDAPTQEMLWQQARYGLMRQAYRALAALREPTEAMLAAAEREWDGRMSFRSTGAWQAMIDAAIATEAGTAETPKSGSVHEGAGPEDIAHD